MWYNIQKTWFQQSMCECKIQTRVSTCNAHITYCTTIDKTATLQLHHCHYSYSLSPDSLRPSHYLLGTISQKLYPVQHISQKLIALHTPMCVTKHMIILPLTFWEQLLFALWKHRGSDKKYGFKARFKFHMAILHFNEQHVCAG